MTREPTHLNSELSSGNTLHLTQREGAARGNGTGTQPHLPSSWQSFVSSKKEKDSRGGDGGEEEGGQGEGKKKKEN